MRVIGMFVNTCGRCKRYFQIFEKYACSVFFNGKRNRISSTVALYIFVYLVVFLNKILCTWFLVQRKELIIFIAGFESKTKHIVCAVIKNKFLQREQRRSINIKECICQLAADFVSVRFVPVKFCKSFGYYIFFVCITFALRIKGSDCQFYF